MSTQTEMGRLMHIDLHKAQEEPEIAHLYNTYAQGMLTYVQMQVTSQEDAEDIVVEVFLAALENSRFKTLPEKAKQLWLWRVAHNKIVDTYRRSKFRKNVAIEQVADSLFEDEIHSPEYAALRQEDYIALHAHLQSLPALQQEILRLRFGQELSCREIANTLGKQENAVRVTLSRSLNLLRGIYHRKREE
ncbi:MAG TPA: sigma-70 family RNA polymerase sigma factor [Ktedonobacteraceae bacterium]|nr:sigma-70 family RNA polymerase sigma factor [Ktedonobacteraceae bacterium]